MHTDRKIGFAMGILLIGIVAALFFRNEPLLQTEVPAVRRERELNETLRERDVAVYLNESVEEDVEDSKDDQPWTLRDVLRNMTARNKTQPSAVSSSEPASRSGLDGRQQPSLDGFRRIKDTPHKEPDDGGRAGISPLAAAAEPQTLPPLFPTVKSDLSKAATESAPTTTPAADFQPPEEFDEYTVKYGDTLSGIAQQTLGSQARYQDIYEANRDRIASPDRLNIGKTLRIPRMTGNPPKTY